MTYWPYYGSHPYRLEQRWLKPYFWWRHAIELGQVKSVAWFGGSAIWLWIKWKGISVTAPCSSQFNFNSLLHKMIPAFACSAHQVNHHVVQFCPWFCGEGRKERHHTEIFPLTIPFQCHKTFRMLYMPLWPLDHPTSLGNFACHHPWTRHCLYHSLMAS